MKEKFINSSISLINKYEDCDDLKIKKLKYGLEGIYSLVIKISAVFIIALITKTLKETSLFLLFYAGIRTFSYGIHAKSNLACWITTILIYNIVPLIFKNIHIPNTIGFIILGTSLMAMLLWAPADTPKRPLIRKKHRIKCKIISVIVILIYAIIYLKSNNNIINNCLLYALIIQILFINPISYKITNTQFNNYLYYKKTNTV